MTTENAWGLSNKDLEGLNCPECLENINHIKPGDKVPRLYPGTWKHIPPQRSNKAYRSSSTVFGVSILGIGLADSPERLREEERSINHLFVDHGSEPQYSVASMIHLFSREE